MPNSIQKFILVLLVNASTVAFAETTAQIDQCFQALTKGEFGSRTSEGGPGLSLVINQRRYIWAGNTIRFRAERNSNQMLMHSDTKGMGTEVWNIEKGQTNHTISPQELEQVKRLFIQSSSAFSPKSVENVRRGGYFVPAYEACQGLKDLPAVSNNGLLPGANEKSQSVGERSAQALKKLGLPRNPDLYKDNNSAQ